MIRFTLLICFLILVIHIPVLLPAQVAEDYRSFTINNNWANASSWQKYDGLRWVSATTWPKFADGAITVSEGHTIVVNFTHEIDQTLIKQGGTILIIPGGTLKVFDGTGDDLVNQGILNNIGVLTTAASPAQIVINNNGVMSNLDGGTIEIGSGMKLINSNTLNNHDLVTIKSDAIFQNLTLGTITNHSDGNIDFNDATFDNRGTTNNLVGAAIGGLSGTVLLNSGTLKNEGTVALVDNCVLTNELNLFNKGYINVYNTSVNNRVPGVFENEGEINLYDQSFLLNQFNFKNKTGAIINLQESTSRLINEAQFENTGTIEFIHGGKFINTLSFNNLTPGKITMSGATGKFTNSEVATFTNTGLFTINSGVEKSIAGAIISSNGLEIN